MFYPPARLITKLCALMLMALMAWAAVNAPVWAQARGGARAPTRTRAAAGAPLPAGVLNPATPVAAEPVAPRPSYKQLPANPDRKELTRTLGIANDIVRGTTPLAGNEESFDKYFNEFFFPQWTVASNVPKLSRQRTDLKRRFLWAAKSPQAHTRINDLTLKMMSQFAFDLYHPYVRYNAMLMIADLNEREPTAQAVGAPYQPALKILLTGATATTASDGVKVAALIGLLRHAEAKPPADQAAGVRTAMLAIVGQQTPPPNRSMEGHNWMRRRAVDILRVMGEQVPPALVRSMQPVIKPPPVKRTRVVESLVGEDGLPLEEELMPAIRRPDADVDPFSEDPLEEVVPRTRQKPGAVEDPLMESAAGEEPATPPAAAARAKPRTAPADEIPAELME